MNQFDVLVAIEKVVNLLFRTHIVNSVVSFGNPLENLVNRYLLGLEDGILLVNVVYILDQGLCRLSILNGEKLTVVHNKVVKHHHIV